MVQNVPTVAKLNLFSCIFSLETIWKIRRKYASMNIFIKKHYLIMLWNHSCPVCFSKTMIEMSEKRENTMHLPRRDTVFSSQYKFLEGQLWFCQLFTFFVNFSGRFFAHFWDLRKSDLKKCLFTCHCEANHIPLLPSAPR